MFKFKGLNSISVVSLLFGATLPLFIEACSKTDRTVANDPASLRSDATLTNPSNANTDVGSTAVDESNSLSSEEARVSVTQKTKKVKNPALQSPAPVAEESAPSELSDQKLSSQSDKIKDRENLTNATHLGSKAKTKENAPGPTDNRPMGAR